MRYSKLVAGVALFASLLVPTGAVAHDGGAEGVKPPTVDLPVGVGTTDPRVPPLGFRLPLDQINRADLLPALPINDPPIEGEGSAAGCYPSGHSGYQAECRNPNYQFYGSYPIHWAPSPYNQQPGDKTRYVFVVDEVESGRVTEWIQWHVNNENQYGPFAGHPQRPHYLYYTGSYLRANGYPNMYGCNGNTQQFMEICPSSSPYANWSYSSGTHYVQCDARVVQSANDMYTGYTVLHEFGHCDTLAHNTDRDSAMTYESSVGNQYLFYNGTDRYTKHTSYDGYYGQDGIYYGHHPNP